MVFPLFGYEPDVHPWSASLSGLLQKIRPGTMKIHDGVGCLNEHSALACIASRLAPTVLGVIRIPSHDTEPVGASMLAMVVNDNACCLNEHSALACIASMLAPTVFGVIPVLSYDAVPVGASMLAMVVNDDAGCLNEHSALACIASKLAPTVSV
jgi:hypothetical protein